MITIINHKQVGQLLQHLGMIAQQVDQGIVIIDLNRTIRFVNMPWAKIHGYKTSNELLGKQISIIHTQEHVKAELYSLIEKTRCTGQSDCVLEHERVDGATFPAHMKMIVLKNEKGKVIGFIVITTDLTERKLLEETVTEVTKQVKELQEHIKQLQCNIHEQEQIEGNIKQQADELRAGNEQLKQQITEQELAEEYLKQKVAESTAANEQLKDKIVESEKTNTELREQYDELKGILEEFQDETNEYCQEQKIPGASTGNIGETEKPIKPFGDVKLKAVVELANRLR
jgi:PAS domain S-box-containing protein